MSIAPVSSPQIEASEQAENAGVRSGSIQTHPAAEAQAVNRPVSGSAPKQQSAATRNVPATYDLPQDVVEVHQDPQIKNQIIVQYLDRSKNLILQVPSSGELTVERGIAAESQQVAKLRASETAAAQSGGEKTHGNKL
jgi:hypothetical protein